jgi:hypothetical protein
MPDPTNVPSSAGLLLLSAAAWEPRLTAMPGRVTAWSTADSGSCQWACRTSTRPCRLSVVAKAVLGGARDWLSSWPPVGIVTSLYAKGRDRAGVCEWKPSAVCPHMLGSED